VANKGDIAFSPASDSTNGRPILVAATASPGTLIHVCNAGSNEVEDVEIWASNYSTSLTRTLYVELGGTTASDTINIQLRPSTTVTVCKIRLLSTVSIRAYDSSGADVRVWAFMERWTY
jgi:hypothetical protein